MEIKQLNYILKFFNDLARQVMNKIADIGKKNRQSIVADVDIMLKELKGIMSNYGQDIQQAIDKKEITLEPVQEAIRCRRLNSLKYLNSQKIFQLKKLMKL